MTKMAGLIQDEYWMIAKDGDIQARAIFGRHYSFHHYRDGRLHKLFVGPGEKIVLITAQGNALFIWRKFIDKSGQTGINCTAFRNESQIKSSDLIKEAMSWAWRKWPGQRLYTYVNAAKIRSTNPGYCFKQAGWKLCGQTKKGLKILEIFPGMRQ